MSTKRVKRGTKSSESSLSSPEVSSDLPLAVSPPAEGAHSSGRKRQKTTHPVRSKVVSKATPAEAVSGLEIDEFEQVTRSQFVDQYRITDLGYGGDVYYQPDVSLSSLA
jgi:hypothetical protein